MRHVAALGLALIVAPPVSAQTGTICLPDSQRAPTLDERVRGWWQAPARQEASGVRAALRVVDWSASPGTVVLPPLVWGLAAATDAAGPARGARRTTEAVLLGAATTGVLKWAFGRARPSVSGRSDDWGEWRGATSGYQAFPSGHTTVAVASATTWMIEARGAGRAPVVAGAAAFAVGAGLARMYFDRHWLTDVLAGVAVGTLSAVAVQAAHRQWGTP